MFDPSSRGILERFYKGIDNFYLEWSDNLYVGRNDKEFMFVTQWTDAERASFSVLNKPLLTYNNLICHFRKIVGQQRYNTCDLEVGSLNGAATQEAITLRANLIRGIEYESRANIAYQQAFEDALSSGMGFIRLEADYESTRSFKQKIMIKMEQYPEKVFFDPSATEPTKTDGEYMGRSYEMTRTEFESKYPDIPYPQSFPTTPNYFVGNFNWGTKDSITICEYYEKKWSSFTIYQLSDGREVTKKEYKALKEQFEEQQLMGANRNGAPSEMPPAATAQGMEPGAPDATSQPNPEMPPMNEQNMGQPPSMAPMEPQAPVAPPIMAGVPVLPSIIKSRKTREYKIVCYKCIYGYVLEKYDFPGAHFPIIAVMGDEKIIKGKRRTTSFVTYAKDPQRFLNLTVSDLAQSIKNNRKERFMATRSNVEGFEDVYANPENVAGFLPYNVDNDTQAPPIPLPTSEVPATIINLVTQSQRDLKTIIGVYQDGEDKFYGTQSGQAIREMLKAGDSANLIFFDNLKRAQEQVGRTILSMVPEVYDTERDLVIKTVEGVTKKVTVNKAIANGVHNDLTGTGYDVTITSGPNFAVQKSEAMTALQQIINGWNPQISPLIADILAKNIDIEDSIELIKRFKTLVPLSAIPPEDLTPQQQQKMQQQQMQQEKMQQEQQKQIQQAQEMAQSKVSTEAAKAQAATINAQAAVADSQTKQQMNQVKITEALIESEADKVKAYAEISKAGMDERANMAASAAKLAQAHAHISDKHFETIKHIHDLTQNPVRPVSDGDEPPQDNMA